MTEITETEINFRLETESTQISIKRCRCLKNCRPYENEIEFLTFVLKKYYVGLSAFSDLLICHFLLSRTFLMMLQFFKLYLLI